MSYSSNKRVDMEISLMKAASPELDSSPEALSRRLSILESAIKSGNITNIAKNSDIINNTNSNKLHSDENNDTNTSETDVNTVIPQEDAISQEKVNSEQENDKIMARGIKRTYDNSYAASWCIRRVMRLYQRKPCAYRCA